MKRFWFIIAAVGFIASMNAESAPPFYKVQCYDIHDKLVNCNDIAKMQKHAKKKSTAKIAKVKGKKSNALAQKKARDKAIALRKLAKQNAELKAEMEALRKANLLAAAKTTEKPADTAQLAAAPAVPTSTTQIAKNIEPAKEAPSAFSFDVGNWLRQGFKDTKQPLTNELDLAVGYQVNSHLGFAVEQDIDWNWSNPNNAPKGGFALEDIQFIVNYEDIYHSESKETTMRGDVTTWIGTSDTSRTTGQILAPRFRLQVKTFFNDNKTFFRFDPYVIPIISRFSTGPSTVSDPTQLNDSNAYSVDGTYFEKLTPNTRLETGLKVLFHQRISEKLAFEAYTKYKALYTYADEISLPSGGSQVLADARWAGAIEIAFPKINVQATDAFLIEGWFQTSGDTAHYKLFGSDAYNTLMLVLRLSYSI